MGTRPREAARPRGREGARGAAKRSSGGGWSGGGLLRGRAADRGEHTVNIHGENPRRIRTCCD